MKRLLYIVICIVMASCSSIEQLAIDYMQPAQVSFPPALRRVAVVNNVATATNQTPVVADNISYYNGDATLGTEALAQALANENYFDEVIICDSALRSHDTAPRETLLQPAEVERLTKALDVDFLIALENIQFSVLRKITHIEEWNTYVGSTDAKIYTGLRVYMPGRRVPLVTLNEQDSIFWQTPAGGESYVRSRLIADRQLIDEASRHAGTVPIASLLPTWKHSTRYLFVGGSVNMRDAAVYVREQQWEAAVGLWKQTFEAKKPGSKQKMMAAYNLAVGYEMLDDIAQAIHWAEQARELARPQNETADATIYHHIVRYLLELQQRSEGLMRLKAQMSRF